MGDMEVGETCASLLGECFFRAVLPFYDLEWFYSVAQPLLS